MPLTDKHSVFQAEVLAIIKACEHLKTLNIEDKIIKFYIDSQAAIKAIDKYSIKSALALRAKIVVNEVSAKNIVILKWIPSHVGTSMNFGNELVDKLAKQGTTKPDKVKLPFSNNVFYNEIEKWSLKMHEKRWANSTDCRQTKMTCPKVNRKVTKFILKMSRKKMMYATQILTGHASLGYHLKNMKIIQSDICEKCGFESETVDHFVRKCPFYFRQRWEIFKEFKMKQDLHKYSFMKIMKFVTRTKRLKIEDEN